MAVERRRDAQNRPAPPRRDVEATVWAEHGAARVEVGHRPRVAHDASAAIKGEHPVHAVQVDQRTGGINAQTTRICDPGVVAERADELAFGVEGEHRVMATAVGATCTGDEEAHRVMLTRISGRFSPAFRKIREPYAGQPRGSLVPREGASRR